jgi:hypothetical protein
MTDDEPMNESTSEPTSEPTDLFTLSNPTAIHIADALNETTMQPQVQVQGIPPVAQSLHVQACTPLVNG